MPDTDTVLAIIQEKAALVEEAPNIIDSSWHFSWHWDRTPVGELTLKGWRQMLADGDSLLAEREGRLAELRAFLGRLRPVVARENEVAAEAVAEGWVR